MRELLIDFTEFTDAKPHCFFLSRAMGSYKEMFWHGLFIWLISKLNLSTRYVTGMVSCKISAAIDIF